LKYHVHVDVMDALKWDDGTLISFFRGDDDELQSADEIKEALRSELKKGILYIASENCDNRTVGGKCAGHMTEDKPPQEGECDNCGLIVPSNELLPTYYDDVVCKDCMSVMVARNYAELSTEPQEGE